MIFVHYSESNASYGLGLLQNDCNEIAIDPTCVAWGERDHTIRWPFAILSCTVHKACARHTTHKRCAKAAWGLYNFYDTCSVNESSPASVVLESYQPLPTTQWRISCGWYISFWKPRVFTGLLLRIVLV